MSFAHCKQAVGNKIRVLLVKVSGETKRVFIPKSSKMLIVNCLFNIIGHQTQIKKYADSFLLLGKFFLHYF